MIKLAKSLLLAFLLVCAPAFGAVKLSPIFNDTQLDNSGNLANGFFVYTYVAGTTTPQTTYTDATGTVPQANPVALNARGEPANPFWLTIGLTYKFVLKDASNNLIRTIDNVTGVNDSTITLDQWIAGPTPTYVSASQFTLLGDQTSVFEVGRRVKLTVTAGTVYGTITATAFTTLTTVTVGFDNTSVVDSGLSAAFYGLLSDSNDAVPRGVGTGAEQTLASATTTSIGALGTENIQVTGTTTITGFGVSNKGVFRRLRFAGALTLTYNATSLILPGAVNITTAVGDVLEAVSLGGGNWYVGSYTRASGSPLTITVIRSYLAGLTLSNASASSGSMVIAAGQATDSTNTVLMSLPSAYTKTTAAWTLGTGVGGLDTGSVSVNTWYHWYEIERVDTGVVDCIFSLSASAPTLPANYTIYRRIGSGFVDTTLHWVNFTQDGDLFQLSVPVLETTSATPGTSAVTLTLANVPTGVNVRAILNNGTQATQLVYFSDLATTDAAPSATAAPLGTGGTTGTGSNFAYNQVTVRTNTSAQVRYRTNNNSQIYVTTVGWLDQRGKAN